MLYVIIHILHLHFGRRQRNMRTGHSELFQILKNSETRVALQLGMTDLQIFFEIGGLSLPHNVIITRIYYPHQRT